MLLHKPNFPTCIKTIRQIKRLKYPMIEVWQCLALSGSVCPSDENGLFLYFVKE